MENFCPDALRLFRIKVLCTGDNQADCPLVGKCPRLILEEAMDEAIPRVIDAMVEVNEIKRRGYAES